MATPGFASMRAYRSAICKRTELGVRYVPNLLIGGRQTAAHTRRSRARLLREFLTLSNQASACAGRASPLFWTAATPPALMRGPDDQVQDLERGLVAGAVRDGA